MRIALIIASCLSSLIMLTVMPVCAEQKNSNEIVNQLNQELEKVSAFLPEDLKGIRDPMRKMVEKGATEEDLRHTLINLSNIGIKGPELKSVVNSMNKMVQEGENPKEAGNVVSQAAHRAKAGGLKGKDLSAMVHDAIEQRKIEREKLKKQQKEFLKKQELEKKKKEKEKAKEKK